MKRRAIAMLLALSVSVSGIPVGVFAEEEFTMGEEAAFEADVPDLDEEVIIADSEELVEGDEMITQDEVSESENMDVIMIGSEGIAEGEDSISEEIILDSEDTEMEENDFLQALEDESEGMKAESEEVALKQTTIGGSTYAFADVGNVEEKENLTYVLTVSGRGGTTTTYYAFADLKQLADTDYYYLVTAGADLAGKEIYAYTGDAAYKSTYTALYQSMGASAEGADYDVISSATNYTGFHAKDISGTVIFGTNTDGNKAISGVAYGRTMEKLDGNEYVTAMILSAAGEKLSDAQTKLCSKKLKANPTVAPSQNTKAVSLASASYTTSKYGFGEIDIVPDDTVSGYVWSEYWDNVYGATISDGTTTVGAVHWIDLYGEAATSGPHYNKVQLALNSGTSVASNAAEVHRYDAFVENGALKPAIYTVTIYAEGYENLTASVDLRTESSITLKDTVSVYDGKAVLPEKELIGNEESVSYTYYSDAACTEVISEPPADAGTYYVVAAVAEDRNYLASVSNPAKITIAKADSAITLKATKVTYTGKAVSVKATVKGSSGKVTYKFYSDAICKKALSKAPINAGTYYVIATVKANANYNGATSSAAKLVIEKKAASIKVNNASLSKTFKLAKTKKAAQKFTLSASVDSKGTLSCTKVSGHKSLTISKTGKVTLAKTAKKGTYTMKVKITSAAKGSFKAANKTVTVKVVVK